jgi:hypothetical protein
VHRARIVVEVRVAPRRAALAHRPRCPEEPYSRLEPEVLRRQRADGADELGHQRVIVVEHPAGREEDLAQVPPLALLEHGILRDLLDEPHAAGAHDAPLRVVHDRRPEAHALGLVDDLVVHALLVAPVLEPVVLQPALARLIADRAVDRVVQEQHLLHRLPGVGDVRRALALDLHPVGARPLAGRLELRLAVGDVLVRRRVPLQDVEFHRPLPWRWQHLDQAHPAVRRDREAGVPAVVGDVDPRAVRGLDDGVACLERDLSAV